MREKQQEEKVKSHTRPLQLKAAALAASTHATKNGCLIDPRTSSWIGRWDAVTSLALLFVAFVTPYEVALLDVHLDALFIVNRIVDSMYVSCPFPFPPCPSTLAASAFWAYLACTGLRCF